MKCLSVIDYGCGSGILSIAAILLGAKDCLSVDNDPQALASTKKNAKRNNLARQINIQDSDNVPDIEADILISNILFNTLLVLRDKFNNLIKTNGTIVLSGIMKDQKNSLVSHYSKFFRLNSSMSKGNWCLIEMTKKN